MRHRTRIVALAAAAMLLPAAGQAKEVRFPAAHPRIALDVPDDWSVAETPLGLELQSPQKDSLVLAGMTGGDRKSVDGWSRRALAHMASKGVIFAKTGPAKPAAPTPEKSDAAKPMTAKPMPTNPAAEHARANGDRPYTFGMNPSVEPPKVVSEDNAPVAGRAGDIDLPTISNTPSKYGMKPSGHFLFAGGVLRGQPVDVELTVFPLGKDKRLLMEQESGATDARGVMIVRSLRDLTQ